jgi:hypothetical protein
MTALAAATLASATPAFGAATLNYDNTNQNTFIHASKDDTSVAPNVGQLVYGNTNTISGHDVAYYGFTTYDLAQNQTYNNTNYGTSISITDGGGFAQIFDTDFSSQGGPTNNLYAVLMDPTPLFNAYSFSISLDLQGNATANMYVYYMLSSGGGWLMATNSPLLTGGSNGQFSLTGLDAGQTFDKVLITTMAPIQMFKQNSINLMNVTPSVPEPGTWALMLLGFGGLGMTLRRRRNKVAKLLQIA